ncbi:MAG: hypothetical protein ACHBNF_09535 [Chromatiales bacterium]
MRYLGGALGIASVAAGIITYVGSTVLDVRRKISWHDSVRVLAYDQRFYAFANEGDGDVYLSHITVHHKDAAFTWAFIEPIQKAVKPESVIKGDTRWKDRPYLKGVKVVSGVSDEEWAKRYASAKTVDVDGCIHKVFMSRNDPNFLHWNTFLGKKLRTFDVQMHLYYYSPHELSMQSVAFDGVGVLFEKLAGCKEGK